MQASLPSSVRVFIAEDSLPVRERVSQMLVGAEISVVGEDATVAGSIRDILLLHPDVVVLDHHLEGGTGLDVLRVVHVADPRIAFVVFSNNAMSGYRKRYMAEGAADYLDKATEFHRLAQAVRGAALKN